MERVDLLNLPHAWSYSRLLQTGEAKQYHRLEDFVFEAIQIMPLENMFMIITLGHFMVN